MECVLYGVGSPYVYDVYEILERLGWRVRGLVANIAGLSRPESLGPVVGLDGIPAEWLDVPAVLPLVTPGHRQHLEREARSVGFQSFPAVVDPTSVVAQTASVGAGTVVNAGVVIGANGRLGPFGSVNRSASIGHDAVIGDYASIGPASVLCGQVCVARGAFVGAGAVILPQLTVGANAVVGAGSVVVGDVPANSVVIGNPARVIKKDNPGHNGVSVDGDELGVSL